MQIWHYTPGVRCQLIEYATYHGSQAAHSRDGEGLGAAPWWGAPPAVCGPLHTEPLGTTLDGTMIFGPLGRLQIGHITASRHRVGLTPELARAERHPVAKM